MENSLETYKRMFDEARDLTAEARKESEIDGDYFHGYQWTAAERETLRKRKQPDLVFNRVRPSIHGTIGVLKQGQSDPRAYGRNPQDEDAAEVASKVCRYISDKNRWDVIRMRAAKTYAIEGTAAVIVEVDDEQDVKITPIRWEEFFYDPRSRENDFSDARYMGVAKWMYADEVALMYDKNPDELMVSGTTVSETFEDRPQDAAGNWIDKRNRRVMTVELYYREKLEWKRCVFCGATKLEEGSASPYQDDKGKAINPIIGQTCFVDRDNNRYGLVRDMRGPQDEINKRRSKLLHLLNNRQVYAQEPGAEHDTEIIDLVRKEAARPDGVMPYGWAPIPLTDMTAGQFNLLAESKAEIERMGPNPSLLAREGENSSGRNNLIRQQAGLTEQAVIFGGFEDFELRVYRQCWQRAKQFWTEPDWIRITDDEGASEFIQINEPVMGPPQVVMGPGGIPTLQPTIIGYNNRLAELDVDIIMDTVPDTANLAQEQFMALVDLARAGVPIDPMLLLESSSLPKKREIMEKLEEKMQQPDPMRELQQRDAAAEIQAKEQDAEIKNVEKHGKALDNMMKEQELRAVQSMPDPNWSISD